MAQEMDTTTWILLAIVFFLLIRQKASAATSTPYAGAAGAAGAGGAAGAAGKTSLLQQLLNPNQNKPSAGSGGGGGSSPGAGSPVQSPTSTKLPTWLQVLTNPKGNQVATIPSTLSSLIPSIPPPTYNLPEMDYPGITPIATIPSDTSNIFITPDEPPTYEQPTMTYQPTESVTSTVMDTNGNPIPVDFSGSAGDSGTGTVNTIDSTSFSPVDTQTIDTSTLGQIPYLPDTGNAPDSTDPSSGSDTMWFDGTEFSGGYGSGGDGGGGGLGGYDFSYDMPDQSFSDDG